MYNGVRLIIKVPLLYDVRELKKKKPDKKQNQQQNQTN